MLASEKLKKIEASVRANLSNNKDLDFVLKDVPDQIKKRTRLGKGVSTSGELVTLKPLESDPYINKRRNAPDLSPETRPNKSNLTFTGQMLEAIKGTRAGNIFTFIFSDERAGGGPTNSALSRYAAEKGRRFFDLSNSERVGLRRKISKVITESIKKLFDN